jgi:hypothetical protein
MLDDAQHVLDLLIGRSGRALSGAIECVAIDFARGGRVAGNRTLAIAPDYCCVFVYGVAYLVLPELAVGLVDRALEVANPLT